MPPAWVPLGCSRHWWGDPRSSSSPPPPSLHGSVLPLHPPCCGAKTEALGGLKPRVQLTTSTVMSWGRGAAGTAASPPRVPAGRSRLPVFWRNLDLFFCLDFIFLFGFFLSWLHRSPKGKADTSEYAGESFRAGVKQDVERFSRHNSALLERCRQDGDAHRCCGRNERN